MTFFRLKTDLDTILSGPFFMVIVLLCITILTPTLSEAEIITPYQSVEQALQYSPRLQALTHSHQAAQFDLEQSRGRYLPSVDLSLGYGLEQHSDRTTRRPGAVPADEDWDSRGDATLSLTQKVYDGGETSQQIVIQNALLDSAQFQIQSAAQAVALDAITAHLDVFRRYELTGLAEKNLAVHQNIYQSLAERAQAGAGSITDVTQAQARLARAQSTRYISKADLSKALANYTRMVGFTPAPEDVTYADVPEALPKSLDKALELMVNGNPELLVLTATLAETDARVTLSRSTYKPKIDIQLRSRYNDQLEGDPSWQNTNDAMLNLRWNLFNGGQDKAREKAALSRKYQSRSARDDKLFELQEATSAAWATYKSLHGQKVAYRNAVDYSQKTFDAYVHQFSVSQRSLLDVLSAENDYFQSASQLITVTVNETLAAYQILALTGNLQVPRCSGVRDYPEDLKWLKQTLILPSSSTSAASPAQQEELLSEQGVQALINRWATAWRTQDVAAYLDCYSKQFTPEKGRAYQKWQQLRTRKLTAPSFIELSISDLTIHPQSDTDCWVNFVQSYGSDKYNDQVRKKLLLKFQHETWQIIGEQSTPYTAMTLPAPLPSKQSADVLNDSLEDVTEPDLEPLYTTEIGPCINKRETEGVQAILNTLKLDFSQNSGAGKVKMVRLLEGIYPVAEARVKLAKIKKRINSAYILPAKNQQLGLYLGSFHEADRAARFSDKLSSMGITTRQIPTEIEMSGEIFISQQTDKKTAQLLLQQIAETNINAHLNNVE